MPTPNPLAPVKGAGTTLWVYKGSGDPYANPLSDVDWSRLAKVKDLTPGELTAESYDDSYLDDEDADWDRDRTGAEICRRYQLHAGVDARRAGAAGAAGVV
ncbi:Major tail protein V [Escherichia coli]|nr:Major tail protein V [Escherichia coli]